ncbi:hypothetical protein DFQ26_001044 [Actinomortierella ambigua]|nr:hypothetical protein DFQ26_001044 [Actinomortierella ambigua]
MPRQFKVVIAGGGMAGLMLGHLLERAGIEYEIFERAKEVVQLGSAMAFGANILPAFEQLGMLEEVERISKVMEDIVYMDENLNEVMSFSRTESNEKLGYGIRAFSRVDMYDLLLSKVPAHKIHFGKKVLSVVEDDDEVTLKFADKTTATGDICVGADGGYSAVRQCMYKMLEQTGDIDPSDLEELTFGYYNLVGTTAPMDPAKYPALESPDCKLLMVQRSSSKHAMHTFTVPGNRFCWNVSEHIKTEFGPNTSVFRGTEWGSEKAEQMCNEVRDFKAPFGGVLGDYIDATPKEAISKVMLEEKLFKTWHSSRTILIGDSCHKMLPSAGQGAVNAMQDAVVLANYLYDLSDKPSSKELYAAFKDFQAERYPHVRDAFLLSQQRSKLISGQTFYERWLRKLYFALVPTSVHVKSSEKPNAYRPQASFLPMIPDRGTFKVLPRSYSKRYLEEQKLLKQSGGATAIPV